MHPTGAPAVRLFRLSESSPIKKKKMREKQIEKFYVNFYSYKKQVFTQVVL